MRTVRILPRAEADAQAIFQWLNSKSIGGALRWWDALEAAQRAVAENAEAFAVAPEDELISLEIRQKLFKTPKGSTYRLVYTIRDDHVFVLRIRGPRQPPLAGDEFNP